MMTLFRPQRSTLADAMAEAEECKTREQLESILARPPFPMVLVSVEPYGGIDKRIGWDTYIVMAKFPDKDQEYVVGFTNGPLNDNTKL